MSAIPPEERGQHIAAIKAVFGAVEEVRDLPDGYSFRLANEAAMLVKVADFLAKERLCCPFFGFTLQIEPEGGAVWLSLTGREGVKPFIQAEMVMPYRALSASRSGDSARRYGSIVPNGLTSTPVPRLRSRCTAAEGDGRRL